jgi:glycosyltransferase involved in cell wall biosynthesis
MQTGVHKPSIVFSVTNCICYDQRVLKIAGTVSNLNCDIIIIGRRTDDCCEKNGLPFRTKRFRMIFRKGFLFYAFFNLRLFFYLLFHRFDILVSNDLDTLLPDFLVSELKHLPLIYDSHEFFTGVPEVQNRPFVKWVWTRIEKMIFPQLKHVMTVTDSIAAEYEKEYHVKPAVIRNCSRTSMGIQGYSKQELKIEEDNMLLIFQGGGINIDKGGEELLEAVALTEKVSLIIIGSGDVLQTLKEKVNSLNLTGRVRFIPKMLWEDLIKYTRSADAGMCLEKDTNPNYRFSLPNKLFDYISAGIPVITGTLPEIKKIVEGNECGIIIPDISPIEISKAIIRLRDDRLLLNKLKQNAVKASEELSWVKEAEKVTDFYSKIFPMCPS